MGNDEGCAGCGVRGGHESSCRVYSARVFPGSVNHRDGSSPDVVNDPSHYRSVAGVTLRSGQRILAGDLEALDVQDAFALDRYLANVCKYILRAGRKGPDVEDLKKARAYLDRKIARAERGE